MIADDDIKSAKYLFNEKIYRNVCFLCQQAVEKCLKGLLSSRNIYFPKTHSLSRLNNLLKRKKIVLGILEEDLKKLDSFYIEPRYPDAYFETYTKKEAKEALDMTEYIIAKIKEISKKWLLWNKKFRLRW